MRVTYQIPRYVTLFVVTFVTVAGASAQSTLGTILGSAKDISGAVIPTATVVLQNTNVNATVTASTDSSGLYQFTNVEPGAYQLTVKAPGFADVRYDNIVVLARDT